MIDDGQPLGEHPDITTVDLLPLEWRARAALVFSATWEMLAHYIGFDLFPEVPVDVAELLHLPSGVVA